MSESPFEHIKSHSTGNPCVFACPACFYDLARSRDADLKAAREEIARLKEDRDYWRTEYASARGGEHTAVHRLETLEAAAKALVEKLRSGSGAFISGAALSLLADLEALLYRATPAAKAQDLASVTSAGSLKTDGVTSPLPATEATTGALWRVGRKVGRTLYFRDQLVGMVDTIPMAEAICVAMNRGVVPAPAPPAGDEIARCERRVIADTMAWFEVRVGDGPPPRETTSYELAMNGSCLALQCALEAARKRGA